MAGVLQGKTDWSIKIAEASDGGRPQNWARHFIQALCWRRKRVLQEIPMHNNIMQKTPSSILHPISDVSEQYKWAKEKPVNPRDLGIYGNGAADQIRTGDLILTKDALYLLSYSSKFICPLKKGHIVATEKGLEPSTSGVTGRRSNQLNYMATRLDYNNKSLFICQHLFWK